MQERLPEGLLLLVPEFAVRVLCHHDPSAAAIAFTSSTLGRTACHWSPEGGAEMSWPLESTAKSSSPIAANRSTIWRGQGTGRPSEASCQVWPPVARLFDPPAGFDVVCRAEDDVSRVRWIDPGRPAVALVQAAPGIPAVGGVVEPAAGWREDQVGRRGVGQDRVDIGVDMRSRRRPEDRAAIAAPGQPPARAAVIRAQRPATSTAA